MDYQARAGNRTGRQNPYAKGGLYRFCAAANHGVGQSEPAGKVTVEDITETARRWVPEMRKQGADVVVAIAHSGLSSEPYHALAENSVWYLSGARH